MKKSGNISADISCIREKSSAVEIADIMKLRFIRRAENNVPLKNISSVIGASTLTRRKSSITVFMSVVVLSIFIAGFTVSGMLKKWIKLILIIFASRHAGNIAVKVLNANLKLLRVKLILVISRGANWSSMPAEPMSKIALAIAEAVLGSTISFVLIIFDMPNVTRRK
ncbi:MAG: hypothetical protein PHP69_00185 [Candidatus Omnitrophica bacterium]|jgi:hypothetical protein|nr:hypothetical protein [Candidatus Omnitrophota bacterium]MDD5080776.1 hypothetical protein [Candidatus Omnitrophota bacterium]